MFTEPWNANASSRARELAAGDPAYQALTDLIVRFLKARVPAGSLVLDAGCGLGYLSAAMAEAGYAVTGIDPARAPLDRAARKFGRPLFLAQAIEEETGQARYDAVVANMVLHATPDLPGFLLSAARLLRSGGSLIATLPHPGSSSGDKERGAGRSPDVPSWTEFRIHGGQPHPVRVPYFHRPAADYREGLFAAGFVDVHEEEPAQVGPGRPHDIIVFHAVRAAFPDSAR